MEDYKINQRAENWNKETSALEDNHPYLGQSSLDKINALYQILDAPECSNEAHLNAAILLDMSQSLETILLQKGKIKPSEVVQNEHTLNIQNIISGYNELLKAKRP